MRRAIFAIRGVGSENWPAPWVVNRRPGEPFAMSSAPSSWPLGNARAWVNQHRIEYPESQMAVYRLGGGKQRQVWPTVSLQVERSQASQGART